ncbi:hypothetical protein ACU6U9_13165 [Pseudomonas sp. HK3]|jgi:hypothetical protein
MLSASDKVVSDYLDNLFFDESLPSIIASLPYTPLDSVDFGYRLQPCTDPFALMTMSQVSEHIIWEAFLQFLLLGNALPHGQLKRYVFKQSEILLYRTRIKPQG